MAEHEHGKMDIETQEKTFEGFVRIVSWATVLILVFLLLLGFINA